MTELRNVVSRNKLWTPFCDCDKLAKGEYAALADSEDDSSLDTKSNNLGFTLNIKRGSISEYRSECLA